MNPLHALHHRLVRMPRVGRVASAVAMLAGKTESLLDVGAGDGRVGAALRDALGARVEGVDVHVQDGARIPIRAFDGITRPYPDGAFEIVALCDVLHHATDPLPLLRDALRVARRAVVIKDHYRFGRASAALLLAMDVIGNASQGVLVRGTYLTPKEWLDLVSRAGGRIEAQLWPLDVHALPLRLATRSELQFAARIVALSLPLEVAP